MVNFSTISLSSEISGPGGLFDFDLTLPLVAIQFLVLMLVLNTIFYNPLLTVIDERNQYISENIEAASELIKKSDDIITQYNEELTNVQKEAQLDITNSQKIHKEILEIELNISQKYIDTLLDTILQDLNNRRTKTLSNLEDRVTFLIQEMQEKLFGIVI